MTILAIENLLDCFHLDVIKGDVFVFVVAGLPVRSVFLREAGGRGSSLGQM